MTVFVVVVRSNAESVAATVDAKIDASNRYNLTDDTWLIDFDGTARALSEILGIRDGSIGTGIVFPTTNYSGRAPRDIWEWLRAHIAAREETA